MENPDNLKKPFKHWSLQCTRSTKIYECIYKYYTLVSNTRYILYCSHVLIICIWEEESKERASDTVRLVQSSKGNLKPRVTFGSLGKT